MRELIFFQGQDAIIESELKKVESSETDEHGFFDAKPNVNYIKVYSKGYGENGETYIREHKYFRNEIENLYNAILKHEDVSPKRVTKHDLDDDLPF